MEDDDPEDLYGSQEVAGESKDRPPLEVVDLTAETKVPTDQADVRNVPKNSLFSPNFFLTLITYGLLSYSVCLHCTNLHTPLPFLFYLYDFQNMKTRHPDPFCAILGKGHH